LANKNNKEFFKKNTQPIRIIKLSNANLIEDKPKKLTNKTLKEEEEEENIIFF